MSTKPEIFYALESLPALLGPVQFQVLVNALGISVEIREAGPDKAGAVLARILPHIADATSRRRAAEDDRFFSDLSSPQPRGSEDLRAASPEALEQPVRQCGQAGSHQADRQTIDHAGTRQ